MVLLSSGIRPVVQLMCGAAGRLWVCTQADQATQKGKHRELINDCDCQGAAGHSSKSQEPDAVKFAFWGSEVPIGEEKVPKASVFDVCSTRMITGCPSVLCLQLLVAAWSRPSWAMMAGFPPIQQSHDTKDTPWSQTSHHSCYSSHDDAPPLPPPTPPLHTRTAAISA